ncbi:unnamed protein product [Rhizophagus irregularis]|nr:unnamed protein product [Rhizophagus irregularis]
MSTRGDEDKEFTWDFAYHLVNSFDHGNDFLNTNITDLDLFFGEIYDHNAIVYEMTVPYQELYLFREVIRMELPTSH